MTPSCCSPHTTVLNPTARPTGEVAYNLSSCGYLISTVNSYLNRNRREVEDCLEWSQGRWQMELKTREQITYVAVDHAHEA